jgi:pimeloyl-ACP methyl ester carboxylesterase
VSARPVFRRSAPVLALSFAALIAWGLAGSSPGGRPADSSSAKAASPWRAARRPVLGLTIEASPEPDVFRLVEVREGGDPKASAPIVLHKGSLERCEEELVSCLKARYGTGRLNIPVSTLGGKQFWADRVVSCGWRIQENVFTGHCRLLDAGDTRRAWGTFEACRVRFEEERIRRRIAPSGRRLVVLVHGLFRSKESFSGMEEAIRRAGLHVETVSYPSTRQTLGEHAAQLDEVLERMDGFESVSFVAHSLGGLIVRDLLSRKSAWQRRMAPARLVMLGTPNGGSVIADAARDWLPFRVIAGQVAEDLTTAHVRSLPRPTCEFGVVAGGTGGAAGLNPLLAGDNDGTVEVANARLDGMADFLLVRALHSFLMQDERVIEATIAFLETGRFARKGKVDGEANEPRPVEAEAPRPAE